MGVVEKELGSTASVVGDQDLDIGTQKVLDLFSKLDANSKNDVAAFITAQSALPEQASATARLQVGQVEATTSPSLNKLGSSEALSQAGAAVLAMRGMKKAFRGGNIMGSRSSAVQLDSAPADTTEDDGDDPTAFVEGEAKGIIAKVLNGLGNIVDTIFAPVIKETQELEAEQAAQEAAGATPDELALIPEATQERFAKWEEKFVDYCDTHSYTVTFGILCFLFFYYFIYQWAWQKPISFFIFVAIYASWAYSRVEVQQIQSLDDLEDMLKKRFLLAFEESRVWVGETAKTLYAWFFFFLPFLHDLWMMVAPYVFLYGSAIKQWYLALPAGQQYIADFMFLIFLIVLWQLCRFRTHVRRMWQEPAYRNNTYYAF